MQPTEQAPAAVPVVEFPPRDPSGRDNHFNFLRLLLASLVILSHSSELLEGRRLHEILTRVFHTLSFGELAVDGFFLLSGFLILQSWLRRPDLRDYFTKRVLRIYPGFIVASLVSALIVAPLAGDAAEYFARFNPWRFVAGMALLKVPQTPPVFAGNPFPRLNGAMWTISHEFACYLLVPLLAALGLARKRTGWLLLTGTVFLVSLSLHATLSESYQVGGLWNWVLPDGPVETFRLLSFFLAGGCFYLFRTEVRYRGKWALLLAPVLLAGMFHPHLNAIALATAGAYLFFGFAFLRVPALDYFKSHSDVSYGVYLYGYPTQNLLIWYFPHITIPLLLIASLLICLGLGLLSWHLVEMPFLRFKPRRAPRVPAPA